MSLAGHRCRACGHPELEQVLDLGAMPLADRLRADEHEPEPRHPLQVAFCPACSLVQLLECPPPQELFPADYPYRSSASPAYLAHARAFAEAAVRRLMPSAQVVEIASNDGYLLRNFVEHGWPVLGIDPSPGPAAAARAAGVPTLGEFFTRELAGRLHADGLQADLVIGNNVLAHVPDPNDLLAAMALILKPGGRISVEVPYVRDLVEGLQFDTIYHEHHAYFSALALDHLFRTAGLQIVDIERIAVHGGSLRVSAAHAGATPAVSVSRLLDEERAIGLDRLAFYAHFAERVAALCAALRERLDALRRDGLRVAAYGAAAKGAILAACVGIDREQCAFVVDRNAHKHGRLLPGTRIPVRPVEALLDDQPDVVLLLCWNWADEVIAQQHEYLRRGGRFLIPLPQPRMVGLAGALP